MSFDLDAVGNDREPFAFTFGGEGYTLPTDLGLGIMEHFRAGRDMEALEELLGVDQWKRIVASPEVLGVIRARALVAAYAEHLGFASLGGSSASTAS